VRRMYALGFWRAGRWSGESDVLDAMAVRDGVVEDGDDAGNGAEEDGAAVLERGRCSRLGAAVGAIVANVEGMRWEDGASRSRTCEIEGVLREKMERWDGEDREEEEERERRKRWGAKSRWDMDVDEVEVEDVELEDEDEMDDDEEIRALKVRFFASISRIYSDDIVRLEGANCGLVLRKCLLGEDRRVLREHKLRLSGQRRVFLQGTPSSYWTPMSSSLPFPSFPNSSPASAGRSLSLSRSLPSSTALHGKAQAPNARSRSLRPTFGQARVSGLDSRSRRRAGTTCRVWSCAQSNLVDTAMVLGRTVLGEAGRGIWTTSF
jgi:hypothetical protein